MDYRISAFFSQLKRRYSPWVIGGAVACLAVELLFPQLAVAQTVREPLPIAAAQGEAIFPAVQFPAARDKAARYSFEVVTTAYSSTEDQTDSTPFITASGTQVHLGTAAANFLPFGTYFKVPQYFGDQVFVVEDRMNERYSYRLDLWMQSREQALRWGVRHVKVEVL